MVTQAQNEIGVDHTTDIDWDNHSLIKTEKGHYEYKKLEDGWYTRRRRMGAKVSKVRWIDEDAGHEEFVEEFKEQMERWAI